MSNKLFEKSVFVKHLCSLVATFVQDDLELEQLIGITCTLKMEHIALYMLVSHALCNHNWRMQKSIDSKLGTLILIDMQMIPIPW